MENAQIKDIIDKIRIDAVDDLTEDDDFEIIGDDEEIPVEDEDYEDEEDFDEYLEDYE